MKAKHVHIWFENTNSSTAVIIVEGLGEVEIKNFISDECRARIEAEAILALEQRLGIVCNFDDRKYG